MSHAPFCSPPTTKKPQAEFKHLIEVQDNFSPLLDLSEATSLFPLEFTRTEAPLLELRDVIKFQSQLPSKADLIMQFDQFVKLARLSKADLGTFSAHIGSATDNILSMNRRTLRVLTDVVADQAALSPLNRLWRLAAGRGPRGEADVLRQYLQHAEAVERQTDALILEGEALLLQLAELEGMLDVIRETANQDKAELVNTQEALFSQLWTIFGGNVADRRRLKRNIDIADKLRDTRNQAAQVVQITVEELRRIKNGVLDLQARVMGPANRGVMDLAEIEEQVQYVQDGLDRLYKRRLEGNKRLAKGVKDVLDYSNRVFKTGGMIGGKKVTIPLVDAY
jgi:hypothetical protein